MSFKGIKDFFIGETEENKEETKEDRVFSTFDFKNMNLDIAGITEGIKTTSDKEIQDIRKEGQDEIRQIRKKYERSQKIIEEINKEYEQDLQDCKVKVKSLVDGTNEKIRLISEKYEQRQNDRRNRWISIKEFEVLAEKMLKAYEIGDIKLIPEKNDGKIKSTKQTK